MSAPARHSRELLPLGGTVRRANGAPLSAARPPEGARPLLGRGEALPTQWASLGEAAQCATHPPEGPHDPPREVRQ
jgi:hypothetical protein